MCERKFSMYNVVVEFADGSREVIKYKEFDKTSYKDMMSMYKRVKEEYKDKNCNIKFVGVNKSGEMGVLFTKENIKEVSKKEDQEEIKVDESVVDLLKSLDETILKLLESENKLNGRFGVINKKQDDILHKIENSINISNEEKVKVFDKIHNLRKERRNIKNQLKAINKFNSGNYIQNNMEYIQRWSKFALQEFEEASESKKLKNKVKEYPYIKDSQKEAMVTDLATKYEVVNVDEIKKIIYCYNKCRA